MKRYTLYTWPDSQEFVGNSKCHLVVPKGDSLQLDSSYMVPEDVQAPAPAERTYVIADWPAKQKFEELSDKSDAGDDRILCDYDGNVFVEFRLYEEYTKKKFIFVDFDGVLTLPSSGYNFSEEALRMLEKLKKDTDAAIVIISSWREETLDDTVRRLPDFLKRAAAAQTPLLPGKTRGEEVEAFLKDHPCEAHVILDDEQSGYSKSQKQYNLVKCEAGRGLTHSVSIQAKHLLLEPWVVTDPACDQRCRVQRFEDGCIYEYAQLTEHGYVGGEIDVEDYIHDSDFAKDYLMPYGYKSIEALKDVYGKNWEQICAECIFETDLNDYIDDYE